MRLASVEAGKEMLLQEIRMLGEVKKKLFDSYVAAGPEERVRIRRDLDEIAGSLRQLKVGTQALGYLPAPAEQPATEANASETDQPQPELSQHWMDRFNDLARAHNEPWREELLARALAAESLDPGTVSPRALWLLGTMEEGLFHAFATILDLSSFVAAGLMIPAHDAFNERPIPNCHVAGGVSIGNLVFRLEELGLLADTATTSRTIPKESAFLAGYGTNRVAIRCTTDALSIRGVIPTGLGASVSSFYQPKVNPLGKEIFDSWIASLDTAKFPIQHLA
jgi:hypothetical protein